MKNFTLVVLKSILSVFILVLFFSSCITDRSLSQGDFYKSRVVNKKVDRKSSLQAHHRVSRHAIFKKRITTENNESLVAEKQMTPSAGFEPAVETAAPKVDDIASVDNKLITEACTRSTFKED